MPIPNNGKHIEHIVNSTACGPHFATKGVACWGLEISNIDRAFGAMAVCGKRIAKAGFNGKISPLSLRKTSNPGGRSGAHTRNLDAFK